MNELARRLQELQHTPREVADDIAQQMLSEAIRISRVRTGAMKAGWKTRVTERGGSFLIELSNTQDYAEYQKPDIFESVLNSVDIDLENK